MIVLPLAVYQPGVTQSVEFDVPDSVTGYQLHLARCTDAAPDVWPDDGQLLRVQVEAWMMGQWLPWGSFDAYGGRYVRRDGTVATTSSLRAGLRQKPGRKLRFFLLAAAPVRTSLELEIA
jgi:hypothetical protein